MWNTPSLKVNVVRSTNDLKPWTWNDLMRTKYPRWFGPEEADLGVSACVRTGGSHQRIPLPGGPRNRHPFGFRRKKPFDGRPLGENRVPGDRIRFLGQFGLQRVETMVSALLRQQF